jgi:hypothetical protein
MADPVFIPSRPHSGRPVNQTGFQHFPGLIKSPWGTVASSSNKIAEASERINGNQHVIDQRPSPDFFNRYEKFVSQRHQQRSGTFDVIYV